jgi:regulator of cell morphogenesis and NO signaling
MTAIIPLPFSTPYLSPSEAKERDMNINRETIVGELAAAKAATTRIFEVWKIDYCCNGSLSIGEACDRAGIDSARVIAGLEEVLAPRSRNVDWSIAPLGDLVRHILDTHHRYTRSEMDALPALAKKVASRHGDNHPATVQVASSVFDLAQELLQHMYKEEQILFPYVEALDEASKGDGPAPVPFFGSAVNPIRMMMAEHNMADALLASLRKLTRNYTPPADACMSFRALYGRLADLDEDLREHMRIENDVLFPRTVEMETAEVAFG